MNNTEKEARLAWGHVREISKTRGYINVPIDVLTSLKDLDCVSRCIWITLYEIGYFCEGAATITLQDLADDLKISRSCLESKLKTLIEVGYISKHHNYDTKKNQYFASTYFVQLPEEKLDKISILPTRRECFNQAGRFVTEGLEQKNQIEVSIEQMKTKIQDLEKTPSTSLSAKVNLLAMKSKLKAMSESSEKNLAHEISTPSPTKKMGLLAKNATYNNTQEIDIKNNNMRNAIIKPSPICSFASQRGGQYKSEPLLIPSKIKDKIHRVVRETKSIALPEQVIAEGEFAVARCFTGTSLDHAANVFCKLLREGRWTTPIPMRMARQGLN